MLADLVSTPVVTGATFIYIFSAGIEIDVLSPRVPPQTSIVLVGGFTVRPS